MIVLWQQHSGKFVFGQSIYYKIYTISCVLYIEWYIKNIMTSVEHVSVGLYRIWKCWNINSQFYSLFMRLKIFFRNHQVDDFLKTIVQDSSMLEDQDELLVFMEKHYRLMDQQMFIVSIIWTGFVLLSDQDISFFQKEMVRQNLEMLLMH